MLFGGLNGKEIQKEGIYVYVGASQVVLVVKNPPTMQETQETWVQSLSWKHPLEEGMVTPSSILAWRIPWIEEPGRLSPWGHKEGDRTEAIEYTHMLILQCGPA